MIQSLFLLWKWGGSRAGAIAGHRRIPRSGPCSAERLKFQYLGALLEKKRRHRQQVVLDPGDVLAQTDFLPLCYGSVSLVTLGSALESVTAPHACFPACVRSPCPPSRECGVTGCFQRALRSFAKKLSLQERQVLLMPFGPGISRVCRRVGDVFTGGGEGTRVPARIASS